MWCDVPPSQHSPTFFFQLSSQLRYWAFLPREAGASRSISHYSGQGWWEVTRAHFSRKNFWRENSNELKCIVPGTPVPQSPGPCSPRVPELQKKLTRYTSSLLHSAGSVSIEHCSWNTMEFVWLPSVKPYVAWWFLIWENELLWVS